MVAPLRAVIFDLDGTLIDSTPAIVESFFHTCDRLGRPRPAAADIFATIGHLLEDQFRIFVPEEDPEYCTRLYREHYAEICCAKTSLQPFAREALEACAGAGLRIGFATSKRRRYAEMILEHLGVLRFFDARIGPDEVTHAKPHPEAILKTLAVLGVTAEEARVVGDTEFDVLAARAAGVPCICVTTGPVSRAELEALAPETVCDGLDVVTARLLAAAPGPAPGNCG